MASNPIPQNSAQEVTAARATEIVGTVTAIAAEIEQLIAGSGAAAGAAMPQVERLTALFGNLAGVAIRAYHDIAGTPITQESVLALMPVTTPLEDPPAGSTSGD